MDDRVAAQLADFERALEERHLVGQAVGIMMERYGLTEDAAMARLSEVAAAERAPVIRVAQRLRSTRQLEPDGAGSGGNGRASRMPSHLDRRLSTREVQVMRLIASGASNLEIAESLYLGVNTVKTYIRTAYRKAGVTRRAQAVIWVREGGLSAYDDAPADGDLL